MINEAARCSTKAVTYFNIVDTSQFLLSSPYQWDTIRHNVNSFTLKSYFQNLQGQLHKSIKHIRYQDRKNRLSTEHIFECKMKCNNAKCWHKQIIRKSIIAMFKCICCLVVRFGILSQIYITSEVLLGVIVNLTHGPDQPNIFRITEQIKHLNTF